MYDRPVVRGIVDSASPLAPLRVPAELGLVAAIVALAAGCYSPSPPTGVPCGENNACPSGQQCVAGFCGGTGGSNDASDSDVLDAPDIDAPATCTTWTAHHFAPCAIPAPDGDLVLDSTLADFTWDTNTGILKGKMNTTVPTKTMVLSQVGGPDVLLATINNFTLSDDANITVTGSRPLLLAVWGSAVIDGDISVSASFATAGPGGAAAQTTECPLTATGNPGATGTPSGGGGGGAFQGAGGLGGSTTSGNGTALPIPTVIRGGCAGGTGGGGTLGPRGAGGGAIQITARLSITIQSGGSIGAGGGAGGFGRAAYGGGGGAGAGGYIGLETPTLTVTGTLAANGGGGGGGASDIGNATSGNNGATSGNAAAGGPGAAATNVGACGKGGNGSFGGTLAAQDGVATACGGGGGGGGAGYILFWSPATTVSGVISPPPLSGP